jgi:alkylated DNA repair dioxygenase AlkB
MFGKDIPQPRLVAWFGDPGCEYSYSGISMNLNEWTPQLLELKAVCEQFAGTTFNSTLANLYRNGNDKMSWHSDDEPELGIEPCIASLSLGATRRFKFRHRTTKEAVECSLPSGSLIVMSGLCQKMWEHEVPRETRVTEPRINLTFRAVRVR